MPPRVAGRARRYHPDDIVVVIVLVLVVDHDRFRGSPRSLLAGEPTTDSLSRGRGSYRPALSFITKFCGGGKGSIAIACFSLRPTPGGAGSGCSTERKRERPSVEVGCEASRWG